MNLARVLRRLRLELDQTLRTRAFVSRAVRGLLRPEESLDLIAQHAFLLWSVGGERSARLLQSAGRDAVRLSAELNQTPVQPSPVFPLINRFAAEAVTGLNRVDAFDVAVSVTGTSWVSNAASQPPSSEFLAELGRAGPRSLSRLDCALREEPLQVPLSTFAELARGMVLGLSNYLDTTWPAPILQPRMYGLPSSGEARHSESRP